MRLALLLCAAFLSQAVAPALAAELVVTKSTVPGIEPGTIVDGAQSITLRAGRQLSLIAGNGRVINLTGPYEGVIDAGPTPGGDKLVSTIATLINGQGQNQSQLGAIRSGEVKNRAPLYVDITTSGPQCVLAGKPVVLWHPGGETVEGITIARAGTKQRATVRWASGEATQAWPSSLAVADGATFEVVRQPSKSQAQITLHVVGGDLSTNAHRAAAFAELGCAAQAMALLTTAE